MKVRRGTVAFQPRARLLKLIGEQLISDEVVAMSELVKNAHDADALTVTIAFRGVTREGGEIEVRDDGCGMDRDTLLGRWMEPASSTKIEKGRQVTRLGRRVLGEKGVGRFAADKLARNLQVVSSCKGSRDEISAVIDWDRFDTDEKMLADVLNHWEIRPARAIATHGTLLLLTGLRSTWTERLFRRLSLRLSRLLSPFSENHRFRIRIESDEFPEYSGELRTDFLDKAPYHIEADFNGKQAIRIAVNGANAREQAWNGHGELSCGPVRIRIYAFDLDGEALARIGPRMEARAWLREWTGVSIYRDGFRIWPYGEPHDDWLRLDQRRVNNPVERLSNNQVIGFIDIGRDRNPQLMDQTNREGLIHNDALEDLRRLVYFVFQHIEALRQQIRHPAKCNRARLHSTPTDGNAILREIEQLAARAGKDIARDVRQLTRKLEHQTRQEDTRRQLLIDGYQGLVVAGQLVSGLSPLLPQELKRMRATVEQLRPAVTGMNGEASGILDEISTSLSSLEDCTRILTSAQGGAERRRTIDILREIQAYRGLVSPLLDFHGVEMEVECRPAGVLRTQMRQEDFCCLLQVLMTNSLDWFRGSKKHRIRFSVDGSASECVFVYSDNGPGIAPEIGHSVFNPLYSCKEGGRGMAFGSVVLS